MISAILLAAGSGERMQGAVEDKILAPLRGQAVISYSVRAFLEAGFVDRFTIVYRDIGQQSALAYPLREIDLGGRPVDWVQGGSQRQDSVRHGLLAQTMDCRTVFIHDCARPLVSAAAIRRLHEALRRDEAAVLAKPVPDTVKRLPEGGGLEGVALEDLDRSRLWAMETPQAFRFIGILAAYEHIHRSGQKVTDDTAALAKIGKKVTVVHNPDPNPKLTTPADLDYLAWLLERRGTAPPPEPAADLPD